MESGLAAPSARCLRTVGGISSAPVDFCLLYVEAPQLVPGLISFSGGGRDSAPQSLSGGPSAREVWAERLPAKAEAKELLSPSGCSWSVGTSLAALLLEGGVGWGVSLSLAFVFWLPYL